MAEGIVVRPAHFPGRAPIEGKLAWLEAPEGFRRLRPGSLRGQLVALFGPLVDE